MAAWDRALRYDALGPLASAEHPAISYFARRDLLGATVPPVMTLWDLPACRRLIGRQQRDGSWRYSGGRPEIRSQSHYDLLETYRQVGVLVEKYGLTKAHPGMRRAADFLFSFQTRDGDFRGIYGNQYSPNYTAAITELLIKAGYQSSPQVSLAMTWLLSMRQEDGGWALPLRTRDRKLDVVAMWGRPLEPDRSRPSAHLITGIVLRALAAHGRYRSSSAMRQAADLLKSRFFTRDSYPDHVWPGSWLVFSYPFWWTDLVSALDSLTQAGYRRDDPDVARGLAWLVEHQEPNGLWRCGFNRPKDRGRLAPRSIQTGRGAQRRFSVAPGGRFPGSSERCSGARPPRRRRGGSTPARAYTPEARCCCGRTRQTEQRPASRWRRSTPRRTRWRRRPGQATTCPGGSDRSRGSPSAPTGQGRTADARRSSP
jgi:hypothetical protein